MLVQVVLISVSPQLLIAKSHKCMGSIKVAAPMIWKIGNDQAEKKDNY